LIRADDGRQVAGVMMLGVGVWYLGFGTRWIAWYRGGEEGTQSAKSGQHLVTGVQVCSLRYYSDVRLGWLPYRCC